MNEREAREAVVAAARSLFERGLTHGSTGNISVRCDDRILVTPTGSSLGTVEPDELAVVDREGRHLDGPAPSKEAFLHAAVLAQRPGASAVIHTHSTYSAAVSCLAGLNPDAAIPPITAYFAMRVGKLPLLPYHAPGDTRLEKTVRRVAAERHAMLLANHGPVVAGATLQATMDIIEELEETARIFLLLHGRDISPLPPGETDRLLAL